MKGSRKARTPTIGIRESQSSACADRAEGTVSKQPERREPEAREAKEALTRGEEARKEAQAASVATR